MWPKVCSSLGLVEVFYGARGRKYLYRTSLNSLYSLSFLPLVIDRLGICYIKFVCQYAQVHASYQVVK